MGARQSAHEGSKVVSPTPWLPLNPQVLLLIISFRGWIETRAIVRPEGLSKWKNSNNPIGNRVRDLLACSAVPQYAIYKCVKKKITFLNARRNFPCAIVGAMTLRWRKTLPWDNTGWCDHPATGQVPVCWSLDINRTALYAQYIPYFRLQETFFFSEKYQKLTLCRNTGRSKLLNSKHTHTHTHTLC